MKKTIAVDVDDVMAAEAEYIVNLSNEHWGHNLSLDDFNENWWEMWGVDQQESERRANHLHEPGIVSMYRILDDAHEVLKHLSNKYNLVVLTSRRKLVQAETAKWLDDNFKDIFSEVHYTGFWDSGDSNAHHLSKGELSEQIGADYLIDDQPKHCLGAANVGIETILFGDYPGGRKLKLPKGVTRCKDWKAVKEYFDAKG